MPDPLPPVLEWTPELVRALSDADRLIGRLAGEGGQLPNAHLLIRPFVRREAVLSSRIEGTQATLGELLAAEAGAAVDPYCTVRRVEKQLKIAFTTAQRAVERLETAGIVKQINEAKRDRVYCATALLKILEEPARLVPIEAA